MYSIAANKRNGPNKRNDFIEIDKKRNGIYPCKNKHKHSFLLKVVFRIMLVQLISVMDKNSIRNGAGNKRNGAANKRNGKS